MSAELSWLPGLLLSWYQEHKRDLPWRKDRQPYHVWLSEIMLQQTRVEAVKGYYSRFLSALPTIAALAHCDDDALMKLWEGLGYYSRARNLKKAAQVILSDHGGEFPRDYKAIRALPGIGDYTAGAVSSICFDEPRAAVDGNVLRLVSRLTDDPTPIDLPMRKEQVRQLLEAVYPAQAGDFTQALMELGATVCGPNREPDCGNCPCRERCLAHLCGTACSLPVKLPKKQRRQEHRTVFLLRCGEYYALTKRPPEGLLASLWQLPDTPGCLEPEEAMAHLGSLGVRVSQLQRMSDRHHIFTHVRWDMRCYWAEAANLADGFVWMTAGQVASDAALPTAYRQFWEDKSYV